MKCKDRIAVKLRHSLGCCVVTPSVIFWYCVKECVESLTISGD